MNSQSSMLFYTAPMVNSVGVFLFNNLYQPFSKAFFQCLTMVRQKIFGQVAKNPWHSLQYAAKIASKWFKNVKKIILIKQNVLNIVKCVSLSHRQ